MTVGLPEFGMILGFALIAAAFISALMNRCDRRQNRLRYGSKPRLVRK